MRGLLTVVIPAYNEEKMIAKTSTTIIGILKDANIPYELIFVDDGSKDGTWACIEEETAKDPQVKGLHFSRNGYSAFSYVRVIFEECKYHTIGYGKKFKGWKNLLLCKCTICLRCWNNARRYRK